MSPRPLQWLRTRLAPRERGFTVAAVLTLGLAVAAVTVIVQVAHTVLLAPLPFADEAAVVRVVERHAARGLPSYAVSVPNFRSFQAEAPGFVELAAMRFGGANVGGEGLEAQRVTAWTATHNLWRTLGVPLRAGRAFSAEEERAGGVAVVSERLWRRLFDAEPGAVGRELTVDGRRLRIVGIAPQDMGFVTSVELWLPMVDDETTQERGDRRLSVVGRLAPGVDLAQASAGLAAVAARLSSAYPRSNDGWSAGATAARESLVEGDTRANLLLLVGGVALLLLVTAGNLAGLQLARALGRLGEYGVRHALGASRGRLVRHALGEAAGLAALGIGCGLAIAAAALSSADRYLPAAWPRVDLVAFDPWLAVAVAAAVGVITLAFSCVPALAVGRAALRAPLARSVRSRGDPVSGRARRLLVVGQFALATVILACALGLLGEYDRLAARTPGFEADGVLAARISMPGVDDEAQTERGLALLRTLVERARALPGVQSAAVASELPMGEVDTGIEVAANWPALNADTGSVQASWRLVGADYFDVLRIPLLRGRGFAADGERGDAVVVSAALARRLWGEGDAVGRTLVAGNGRELHVIGVAGDVRHLGRGQDAPNTVYLRTTWLWPTMAVLLRTDGDLANAAQALRRIAAELAPAQPLFDVGPLALAYGTDLAAPRGRALVFAAFALASLLLAAVGIAGVMAQWVAQRRHEFAMRAALGARPARLARLVLRDGLPMAVAGTLVGLLAAAGFVRLLGAWRVEVAPPDAIDQLAAVGLLIAVAVGACLLPMHRAGRTDPARVLRED
jgi:predicted permease